MLCSWFIHIIGAVHIKILDNKSEFALGGSGSFWCLVACVCTSLYGSNKGVGRPSFTNLYIYCNMLTGGISENFSTPIVLNNCDADSLYLAPVMALGLRFSEPLPIY